MRKPAATLLVGAMLLMAACGGDDEEGGGDKADTGAAQTATTGESTTGPTATSDAGAGSSGTVDVGELESCLTEANLELRSGDEPYTDPRGQRRTRQGLEIAKTKYAGYVMWPSDHISDLYVSEDEQAATAAEREAGNFVRAFGLEAATYVQKHGNLVLVFDRPVPTDDEVQQVANCA